MALDWPHAPFEIPEAILSAGATSDSRGEALRKQWEKIKAQMDDDTAWSFADHLENRVSENTFKALTRSWPHIPPRLPKSRHAKLRNKSLMFLTRAQPNLIGGSADLTHSNLTKAKAKIPSPQRTFKDHTFILA